MGFLGDIFDDVVDIVAAPVKIVTTIADKTIGGPLETDLTGTVEEIQETIKTKKE